MTCSSSTSPRPTSTWRRSTGSPGTWPPRRARWSSSRTTGGSSTPSVTRRGSCTMGPPTPTTAADAAPATPGALVVATHGRWFLDAVCDTTWELHDGTVDAYDGGYAAYVLAKAERSRQTAASEQRRQNLVRKELAWLRRGPPARTSKPRFRIDAATELIADEPPARDRLELERFATSRLGKDVLDLAHVDFTRGGRRPLHAGPRRPPPR